MDAYQKIQQKYNKEVKDILNGYVVIEEKVDGCVDINARILMSNLTYKPAGLLEIGDKIIGVEDTINNPKLVETVVENNIPIKKPCYEITTTNRKIIASIDHPFMLSKRYNQGENTHNYKEWVKVKDLQVGDQIIALPIWTSKNDWKTGYIAGIFDGEASLVRSGNGRILSFYQKIGNELDLVNRILTEDGFMFSIDTRQREAHHKRVGALIFRSNWTQILSVLGTYRPQRLLEKAKEKIWNYSPLNSIESEKVINIKSIGKRIVAGLTTRSHTYIAEGLVSHNSQFRIEVSPEGVIKTASKNIELGTDSMFKLATDIAENIFAGYKPLETTTIFCEYLKSVKHNSLAYGRVPNNHLVLFDVRVGDKYLDRMGKEDFAKQFNLEITPALYRGDGSMVTDDTITEMINQMSFLGNTKMEGIVIKAYDRFYDVNLYPYLQGHWMCCKVVRPEFKEVNGDNQVTVKGEVEKIKAKYTTEARYIKAIQHLSEQGLIKNDMSDLKYLFPEVQKDLIAEEAENIKNDLYKAFIKDIERGCTSGLVEFYKNRLQEINQGAKA